MANADTISDVYRLAAFLESNGVSNRDYVACFMTNSPEFVVAVLALSKVGAVAALVNINLRGLADSAQISYSFSADCHQMTP
jgi:acyl-coenzyme A synthetase/AMP-(fatty) acid ligase